MPTYTVRPQLPRKMQSVVDRWLAARRLINRPETLPRLDRALRYFGQWLGTHEPQIISFAQVDRQHLLRYLRVLAEARV